MTDSIFVNGITADGHHGIEGERDRRQPFIADVQLDLNIVAVAKLDRLDTTVDYEWIQRIVRRVIEDKSFELLETLAHTIAEELLAYGGEAVRVKVSKPKAADALNVEEVAVVVERSRD